MDNRNRPVTGFQRGIVDQKRDGDLYDLYKVKSYTCDGVITRWIEAVQGEYEIDQEVYFFMFDDGRGMILGRMID